MLADARPPALLACAPDALVLADARAPALLALAPSALALADALAPALLALAPLALALADARPPALHAFASNHVPVHAQAHGTWCVYLKKVWFRVLGCRV